VLKWPLLRLEDQSKAWERWFALAEVAPPERLTGPVLNLVDAAIDGQGVALARTTLAAWDLISGRIVRPFDLSWRPAGTYWIVGPKATSKLAKIGRFRDWLLAEAANDALRLGERLRRR
jgi:LysR family transcriptional regulator, glycine cleavage system transcriptional activator